MGEFVHDDMPDKRSQRHIPARGPFVQNGTAKQPYRVRESLRLGRCLFGQGNAVVKAGQFQRVVNIQFFEKFIPGDVLDPQDHLLCMAREFGGQRGYGGAGHALNCGQIGCDFVGPVCHLALLPCSA